MTHLMTIRAGVGVGSNAKWHAFTKMTSEHSVVNDLTEHAKIKIKEKNMSVRLRMTSVHAFASQSEEGDAFEIDLSGLNAQVTQLAAAGLFHVKVMFVNTAEQRPQVNAFTSMMAAKSATELPDAKDDSMYYHRISNVLLDRLRAEGLGYQKGDEAGEKAITELLIAVPRALEYVLPFDDECGAFRLRACHIPAAFTTESLGVHRSENSHYVKRTAERVVTESLIKHSTRLYGLCVGTSDVARYFSKQRWAPLIKDVHELAIALNKWVEIQVEKQERREGRKESEEPARAPTEASDITCFAVGRKILPNPMYDALADVLQTHGEYAPVVVTDAIMISHDFKGTTHISIAERRKTFLDERKMGIAQADLYVHIFRRGGPHPNVVHVWKLPKEGSRSGEPSSRSRTPLCGLPAIARPRFAHVTYTTYLRATLPTQKLKMRPASPKPPRRRPCARAMLLSEASARSTPRST